MVAFQVAAEALEAVAPREVGDAARKTYAPSDIAGLEYDSRKDLMNKAQIKELLEKNDLLTPHALAVRMKEIAAKR